MYYYLWLAGALMLFVNDVHAGVCGGIANKAERMICIKTRNAAVKETRRAGYSDQQDSRSSRPAYSGRVKSAAVAKSQSHAATTTTSTRPAKINVLDIHKKKLDKKVASHNPIQTGGKRTIAAKKVKRARHKQDVLRKLSHGKRAPSQAKVSQASIAPTANRAQAVGVPTNASNRSARVKSAAPTQALKANKSGLPAVKPEVKTYVPGEISAQVVEYTDSKSVVDMFDELY